MLAMLAYAVGSEHMRLMILVYAVGGDHISAKCGAVAGAHCGMSKSCFSIKPEGFFGLEMLFLQIIDDR